AALVAGVLAIVAYVVFFFSSRRRHTRLVSDWSSDVCSSDLAGTLTYANAAAALLVPLALVALAMLVARPRSIGLALAATGLLARSEERRVGEGGGTRSGGGGRGGAQGVSRFDVETSRGACGV